MSNKEIAKGEHSKYKPLWELNIKEVFTHNIEKRGQEVVNKLLKQGWVFIHIYTLRYKTNGIWRERPMVVLGKPKKPKLEK